MRTASRILGIIGTCLALLYGGLFLLLGAAFFSMPFSIDSSPFDDGYDSIAAPLFTSPATDDAAQFGGTMLALLGGASAAGGILGLVGSVLVRKRHAASGVLFIIAALLTLVPGFLISVLFILSGIFSFVREKQQAAPVLYAPYLYGWPSPYPAYGIYPPLYPYGTYPQYGYPPPAAPAPTSSKHKEDS